MQGAASPVLKSDGSTATIPVASTATVYTKAFPLGKGQFFGLWVKATSSTGTPEVKIELEQSYALPTTEGAAETTLWVEPDGKEDIVSSLNDQLAHIFTVTPVPMTYGRYKITGLGANPADTTLSMLNFIQEGA